MGETTGIAWTDHTFNPWIGCQRVSPGCEHCYAETFATKRMGLPVWGPSAPRKAMSEAYWEHPARWDRAAQKAGVRRRVFCASMADVFETAAERNERANAVMDEARERLWPLIESTPYLDWQLLTKRPRNIARLVPTAWLRGFPGNVWLGVTAEDETRFMDRWPAIATMPARVRFVSHEPALGPYGLARALDAAARNEEIEGHARPDWVIVGGESGPGARPFDVAAAIDTVRACRRHAVFVKQLGARPEIGAYQAGEWPPETRVEPANATGAIGDYVVKLRNRSGADPSEWPVELRVQEFPRGAS